MRITEFVDTTMKIIRYILDDHYEDDKIVLRKNEYGILRRKDEFNICRLEIIKDGLAINETPQFHGSTLLDINYTGNPETEHILITPAYIIKKLFKNYQDSNLTNAFFSEHPDIENEDNYFEMDTIDKIIYMNNFTEKNLENYDFSYSEVYELLCKLKEQKDKGEPLNVDKIKEELAKIPNINGSILLYDIKSISNLTKEELANINLTSPLIAKKIEVMHEFEQTLYNAYEKGLRYATREMYIDDLITRNQFKEIVENSEDQQFSFGWFATLVNLGTDKILYEQDASYESQSDGGKITRLGFDKKVIPGNVKQYIKTLKG